MEFSNPTLQDSARDLLTHPDAKERAVGHNLHMEENINAARHDDVTDICDGMVDVKLALDTYFRESVQGLTENHVPSTFQTPLNDNMLWPASIEPNQTIIRLERIDDILNSSGMSFEQLLKSKRNNDKDYMDKFVRKFDVFPGQRPAFALFRSEVADDLKQTDWLSRIIDRLGLFHYYPYKTGESYSFALMEYQVKEVHEQAATKKLSQPFATATILECRNNPAFFPVPKASRSGFAVDLRPDLARLPVREFLHCRIRYQTTHLARLAQWTGQPQPDIMAARDRHLAELRIKCKRPDFGLIPVESV